ncbi:hypothetical protein JHK82_027795 [Glycine max]|nr:hypothetical protein JHK82_027795 [Glycine max]
MKISPHVKHQVSKRERKCPTFFLMFLGFLLLLSNYGLGFDFNEDDVLKLL